MGDGVPETTRGRCTAVARKWGKSRVVESPVDTPEQTGGTNFGVTERGMSEGMVDCTMYALST